MSRLKIVRQTRLVGGELLNVDDEIEIDGFLAVEMVRDGTAELIAEPPDPDVVITVPESQQ